MLSESDRKLLEILSKKHLVTKGELKFKEHDGVDLNLNRLIELGLVEKVESLGTAFVITQKGIRAIGER